MNLFLENDGRLRAIWRFVVALIFCVAANYFAATVAQSVGTTPRRFDLAYRSTLMLALLAGFSVLLIWLDRVEGNPLSAMGLGLRRQPWHRHVGAGLLIGSGMIVVAAAVIAVVGSLEIHVSLTPRSVKLAGVELIILVTGAMAEELMFRGYPFQRLVEAMGDVSAVIVLSVLFGAVHLRNPHASLWGFLNTILVGVLFAIAYLRTRSLWMPWAMHFSWNTTLGLIFGLPVSGLTEFAVVVKSRAAGPVWLTGGSYGIEASALGTAVLVLGFVAVIVFMPKREREGFATEVSTELEAQK